MAKKNNSGWGALFGALAVGAVILNENRQEKKRQNIQATQAANQRLNEENERIKSELLRRKAQEEILQERLRQESQRKEESAARPSPSQSFDPEELEKLYRSLAKKYHPDFAQNEIDKEFRTELFKKLNNARDRGDMATLKMYEL